MTDQPFGDDRQTMPGFDESADRAERDVQISSEEGDDLAVTPPDMQPRALERLMAGEPDADESIEERISQEVPDPDSAYGRPENESGLDGPDRVGGDDIDAIEAEDDYLGRGEVYANDGTGRGPESAAMYVEEESDLEAAADLDEE